MNVIPEKDSCLSPIVFIFVSILAVWVFRKVSYLLVVLCDYLISPVIWMFLHAATSLPLWKRDGQETFFVRASKHLKRQKALRVAEHLSMVSSGLVVRGQSRIVLQEGRGWFSVCLP